MTELDLTKLGYREIAIVRDLLGCVMNNRYTHLAKANFDDSQIKIGIDIDKCVFLFNEDGKVLVEYNNKLHLVVTCSECGNEAIETDWVPEKNCKTCQVISEFYALYDHYS